MQDALGARSQTELADKLGVGKAAVSDAKHRGGVPAAWILKLARPPLSINPLWIEFGHGPRRLPTFDDTTPPEIPCVRWALRSDDDDLAPLPTAALQHDPPPRLEEAALRRLGVSAEGAGRLRWLRVPAMQDDAVAAGDWLLADLARRDPSHGGLVLLATSDRDVMLRRLWRGLQGWTLVGGLELENLSGGLLFSASSGLRLRAGEAAVVGTVLWRGGAAAPSASR